MEKRLYEIDSVKYLEIQIDKSLTWKSGANHDAFELNKANGQSTLQYSSHIYAMLLLFGAKNTNSVRLNLLKEKSLRIMFFQSRNSHTGP